MPRRKVVRHLTEEEHMRRLNAELFNLVQGDQGEAHVSDENYAGNMVEFFSFADAQLWYARQAASKMAAFLRKHKRLRQRVTAAAKKTDG